MRRDGWSRAVWSNIWPWSRSWLLLRLAGACAVVVVAAVAGAGGVWGQGQFEREFAKPPPLPSGDEPVVPETPGQVLPPDADKVRFVLGRVEISGNQVYPESELRPFYAPLLGQEVSLAQVFQLADELTAKYRNDGYVLSRVVVPAQSIRDGVVQLQAIEGYVAETRGQGTSAGPRSTIDQHLEAIRNSRPLSASALERELLLMNDLPGLTVASTLAPSLTPGASDLTLDLTERRLTGYAGVNNRGSKSLGPWRMDIGGSVHQLFWGYDRLYARLIETFNGELTYVSLGYDRAIGATGARWGLFGTYVDSQPGTGQNFNLPTDSISATASVSYPWIRSRAQNLSSRLSFTSLDSKQDQTFPDGSVQQISDDSLRPLRLGATYDWSDRFRGVSVVDVEASQGLEVMGASEPGDPGLSGKPDFTKATLYAARLQSIAPRWSILGAVNAQYGANTQPLSERFAFGGEQFGRAYDAAEITGDSGVATKIELRFTDATTTILRNYTLFAFYELGWIYFRAGSNESGQSSSTSAADVGLGALVSLERYVTGYAYVAKPLTLEVAQEGNKDARFFVGIQVAY
jgi:hemolysin activation/secretion protein